MLSYPITHMARTTISISDDVYDAAKDCCDPKNENRDFSSLAEVALREYLTPRGYLSPSRTAEAREFHAKLSVAIQQDPELVPELERLLRRRRRKTLAAAGGN